MPNIVTHKLKVNQVNLLRADMTTNTNPYFVFFGRPRPYQNGDGVNIDATPPEVDVSVNGITYETYQTMIGAKLITSNDLAPMVRDVQWESGVYYSQYDHTDMLLSTKDWYVTVIRGTNRDVFICLSNAGGRPSTVAPNYNDTSAADSGGYETSDGYRWKYMYTISQTNYNKFGMSGYVPVIPNANVSANAVSGAINFVDVTYGGLNYNSYHSGTIREAVVNGSPLVYTIESTAAANADFYSNCAIKITGGKGVGQIRRISSYNGDTKRITFDVGDEFTITPNTSSTYEITPRVVLAGDGQDFEGRALVNASSSNSIYKIEVVNPGVGYTWSTAVVAGNTGGITSANAIITPIISPYGGHGFNPADELHSTRLGISVKFDSTESSGKIIDVNDFRTVGIIKKPYFADVTLTVDSSADFNVGDTIQQNNTGVYGVITSIPSITVMHVSNVVGYFTTNNNVFSTANSSNVANVSSVAGQSNYVNQTTRLVLGGTTGSYDLDGYVSQGSIANGYVYHANTTVAYLTNVFGDFAETSALSGTSSETNLTGNASGVTMLSQITSITQGDFVNGSGEVLYIDNKSPIAKTTDQTETFKIILEF